MPGSPERLDGEGRLSNAIKVCHTDESTKFAKLKFVTTIISKVLVGIM